VGIHVNRNILEDMLGKARLKTRPKITLRPVRLIWACYESAAKVKIIKIKEFI